MPYLSESQLTRLLGFTDPEKVSRLVNLGSLPPAGSFGWRTDDEVIIAHFERFRGRALTQQDIDEAMLSDADKAKQTRKTQKTERDRLLAELAAGEQEVARMHDVARNSQRTSDIVKWRKKAVEVEGLRKRLAN